MRNPLTSDVARAWVDVDLDAVVRNARSYAARTAAPMLPMVKANGYGLGAVAMARALAVVDPWGFGVATIDEARELHVNRVLRPLLICSPLNPAHTEAVAAVAARPSIGDLNALRAWLALGDLPFHLEVDTGMARSGLRWDDAEQLQEARNLLATATGWEGVYTHFHSAEQNAAATAEQWERLQGVIAALGRRPPLVHAANSAAGAFGGKYAADMTRPGIHLYGGRLQGLDAIPVARVSARVSAVRRIPAGASVSYDATWRAANPTTIATVAAGYADGMSRHLSNSGAVELLGHRLRIVGRITMDHLMVDAGDLPVAVGDVATIFGGLVSVDEQAALAGTVSYELLTGLGTRLPRRYHGSS